ncbi:MAG: phenylacetate--CoA ligase family protein [Betaproteobacteria bacterium]|nr:MAG: phenylacetate--CoA ligase family protein [Betaproteobacteria bacterium]
MWSTARLSEEIVGTQEQGTRTPWEPLRSSFAHWNCVSRASAMWWTRNEGVAAIDNARATRFRAMVEYARDHSRFYAEAYRNLPRQISVPQEVPVVGKRTLMAHFDDWVTDEAVTQAGVDAFMRDKHAVGDRYLDRYIIWKSSGTTGEPGVYVQDAEALSTYDALIAVQLGAATLPSHYAWGAMANGGRAALIAATDDHYASIASWQRAAQDSPWMESRGFSVMQALERLVGDLNAYQPAFLASYPTTLALLATEQAAGRLMIHPAALWSGGEYLADATRAEIENIFACPVSNEYGASECMSIASGCREGWLHVNADWVLLEPVDRDYRPTPPGQLSHTVLLTNLANRVQPIIRYDLGDSVVAKPGRCACGSPLPALRVVGRCDDMVALRAENGSIVRLLPIALSTVVEEAAKVHRFQIVQRAPDRLALRLGDDCAHDRRGAWRTAAAALKGYLASQSLPNVRVALDKRPPVSDARSGKLRQVVVDDDPRLPPPRAPRRGDAHRTSR